MIHVLLVPYIILMQYLMFFFYTYYNVRYLYRLHIVQNI